MPLLELDCVTAGYRDATVIEELSFSLDEGQGMAVLGRNGVGKSTLMKTLIGLTRQTGGRMLWQGTDLSPVQTHLRSKLGIGWVPQERNIFPSLTVEDNLRVARSRGRFDLHRVYELFPRLRERRGNRGDKLSGGEQQMLAIGRTLMTNPKLLLLDEPFEGLAPVIVAELGRILAHLREEEGFTTLLVEQHAEVALRLSDQAIVLDRGRIVTTGPAQRLLDDMDSVNQWISV
ncbi:Branched-chain amino acid transport system ATP-binding protein OS=Castellaniella defragrans OX=75697 GN=HNR28_001878 PE=3 SV=1 [Castellaniella defragrans]